MDATEDYITQPGYAYQSSRRYPAEPDIVILSQSDCDECEHVGFATIDGARCAAFRTAVDGKRRFVFQIAHCAH